jgi:hypothetical protein
MGLLKNYLFQIVMIVEYSAEEIECYDKLWNEWTEGKVFSNSSHLLSSGLSQKTIGKIFSFLKIPLEFSVNKEEFYKIIRCIGLIQNGVDVNEIEKKFFSYSEFIQPIFNTDSVCFILS